MTISVPLLQMLLFYVSSFSLLFLSCSSCMCDCCFPSPHWCFFLLYSFFLHNEDSFYLLLKYHSDAVFFSPFLNFKPWIEFDYYVDLACHAFLGVGNHCYFKDFLSLPPTKCFCIKFFTQNSFYLAQTVFHYLIFRSSRVFQILQLHNFLIVIFRIYTSYPVLLEVGHVTYFGKKCRLA